MTPGGSGHRRWTRRFLVAFQALCVLVVAGCVWWGVAAFLRAGDPRETGTDRAERLAGLHHEQHPGKGRYYVPADTVLSTTPDGVPVAYLHYGVRDTGDNNLDDFLRTYDLPSTGTPAPLPEDLRAALPGDEPTEGVLLPEERPGRQVFMVLRPPARKTADGVAGDIYVRATG
ncbi:hypothetical protein [Streptomyces rubellomurinus]|uniref:Uncharacterized protein n=1 Tax=Streptomyces rubellomurinus (strain ATCC 31215) TaxID=359131 RepID=A0A0F2TKG7_STRR3|nr:hypothetical protein [Streptomyces rubellomurinus]KJS62986.1 hypothetical protein VM95_05765 [Streptomyces rubellomurinus]